MTTANLQVGSSILDDIPSILNYGLVGLAFLLAFLSFALLRLEGRKKSPSPAMLGAIKTFMVLSIVLGLGSGLIQALVPNKQTEPSVDIVEIGAPDARRSFIEPMGAGDRLSGIWKAEWYVRDSQGQRIPNPPNPEDTPMLQVNGAEIFGRVMDKGQEIYYRYWFYGRVSAKNNVTLIYWSKSESKHEALVGVVFLEVMDEVGKELRMVGTWRGYGRASPEKGIAEGEQFGWTEWTRRGE